MNQCSGVMYASSAQWGGVNLPVPTLDAGDIEIVHICNLRLISHFGVYHGMYQTRKASGLSRSTKTHLDTCFLPSRLR